jgi:hypothetical protein
MYEDTKVMLAILFIDAKAEKKNLLTYVLLTNSGSVFFKICKYDKNYSVFNMKGY